VHFGVPPELLDRVARQEAVPGAPPRYPDPGSPAARAIPAAVLPTADLANRRDVLTSDIVAMGTMTARGGRDRSPCRGPLPHTVSTRTTLRRTIMNDPVTTLDTRFSAPDAEPTSWEATQEVLENAQMSWVTTVRADGRPHVTPLVAVWLDGALHFTTGLEEQKAVNLRHNPHVVLTTGNSTWDRGLDVVVEGDARRVTDRQTLERLAAAWRTKWDGQWEYGVDDDGFRNDVGGPALVFAVDPAKVLAFGKGTFSHTRHVPR
jgi:general stress protein 26